MVLVEKVASVSEYESDEDVMLTCRLQASQGDQMPFTVNNAGPLDQAQLWLRRAVFGETYEDAGSTDLMGAFTGPAGPTLAAVLEKAGVSGWAVLGLTRLYVVEGLRRRWSGSFDQLEVGPAGPASIPIQGRFRLSSRMTRVEAVDTSLDQAIESILKLHSHEKPKLLNAYVIGQIATRLAGSSA